MPVYSVDGGCCCTGVSVECPGYSFCSTCPDLHLNIDETEFGDCDECWLQERSGGFDFEWSAGCQWNGSDGGPSNPSNQGDCCDIGLQNDAIANLECVYLGSGPGEVDQSLFSEAAGRALPDGTYWWLEFGSSARTLDASSSLCVDDPPGFPIGPAVGNGFAWAHSYQLVESGVCPVVGDWPIHDQATNNGCDGLTKLIVTTA